MYAYLCFKKHGILPSKYIALTVEEKAVLAAFFDEWQKEKKEEARAAKAKPRRR